MKNLASNEITFTDRGSVLVSVSKLDSANTENVNLSFSVRDTAVSIL